MRKKSGYDNRDFPYACACADDKAGMGIESDKAEAIGGIIGMNPKVEIKIRREKPSFNIFVLILRLFGISNDLQMLRNAKQDSRFMFFSRCFNSLYSTIRG